MFYVNDIKQTNLAYNINFTYTFFVHVSLLPSTFSLLLWGNFVKKDTVDP